MVEKIFSKKIIIALIAFIAGCFFLFLLFFQGEMKEISNSSALDFVLQKKLMSKVDKVLSTYSEKGWEETRKSLEEVKWDCKRGSCDPEVFFSQSLDSLANTLANNKEFTYAASTLGILYSGNWEIADLDGDQENEVILLQRDGLNVNYVVLKIIDFQENSRVTSYKMEGLGYFSSPNSSGGAPLTIKILDLTGDAIPEIALFLSPGRGGAQLFVFQYQPRDLKVFFKKNDLFYPEYAFSDVDKDRDLEVLVKGYNPETGKRVEEVLNW